MKNLGTICCDESCALKASNEAVPIDRAFEAWPQNVKKVNAAATEHEAVSELVDTSCKGLPCKAAFPGNRYGGEGQACNSKLSLPPK